MQKAQLNSQSCIMQCKRLQKISNIEKNFIYQCQICFQAYDHVNHIPMIICENYHALCSSCVKSNLFKKEYNSAKNPTGRYLCSKCSKLIDKSSIREHKILKQVSSYLTLIKQKDKQMKTQFYNYIGQMGMNLVAIREDYQIIEQNNALIQKENALLVQENCQIRDKIQQIQKIKGSFEQLKKFANQVQELKETINIQKATLNSIKDELRKQKRKLQIIVTDQKITQQQRDELNSQIIGLRKRTKQLIQQTQGSIELRDYLEQQINNLKNQKKKLNEENQCKKSKIKTNLDMLQQYCNNMFRQEQKLSFQSILEDNRLKSNKLIKIQVKPQILSQQKVSLQQQDYLKVQFDFNERSIKHFNIYGATVTLITPKLTHYASITTDYYFEHHAKKIHSFKLKIHTLKSQYLMVGLMSSDNKNKKNLYNRKGFYALDAFGKIWSNGDDQTTKVKIKQRDILQVCWNPQKEILSWALNVEYKQLKKDSVHTSIKIPNKTVKKLYPVILMMEAGDSVEFISLKSE